MVLLVVEGRFFEKKLGKKLQDLNTLSFLYLHRLGLAEIYPKKGFQRQKQPKKRAELNS